MGAAGKGCPLSCFLARQVYHVFVHSLAQRVLGQIRQQELLKAGDRVGVAVSGGIDSVALLRLLLELRGELGIVVSVVHFNHRLRGAESDADEQFVERLAREHDLEFAVDSDDVAAHAREEGVSVETAARELRYGFFRSLFEEGPQGLKPNLQPGCNGTAEAVPFHESPSLRSAAQNAEPPLRSATQNAHPSLRSAVQNTDPRASAGLDNKRLVLHKIATGHTLDDQAETVLMHLIRGSGLRGLGAIHPRIVVEDDGEEAGEIIRPLLGVRRRELEQYLKDIGQTWREDSTNQDLEFTRNRVRKLLVPLLEKEFNLSVAENLAELSEIARGEEDYWENEVAGWMGTGVHWSEPEWARASTLVQIGQARDAGAQGLKLSSASPASPAPGLQSRIDSAAWLVMNASVDRLWFLGEPVAVQRRVIKAIGEHAGIPLEFKHVEEILRCAAGEDQAAKELSLPLGWKVVREPDELLFVTPDLSEPEPARDYEYDLPLPGRVTVSEAGTLIEARRVAMESEAYNPDHLLDADSLPGRLKVRNWRAGDRFWPAHTKSPKKIKELLQEQHVPEAKRKAWPVVVSGNEIVWVRGFHCARQFPAKPGRTAVLILESPVDGKS